MYQFLSADKFFQKTFLIIGYSLKMPTISLSSIEPMKIRVELEFRGQVQGVGFRYTVCDIAKSFVVDGWVRNCADGSVLLQCEGDSDVVRDFIGEICDRRSDSIHSVDRRDVDIRGAETFHGFEIRF